MTELRASMPPVPDHMRHLPIDDRGFVVPFFVQWIDGKPDHRIMDGSKLMTAVRGCLCWQCGKVISGLRKTFAIGPMCCITHTIAEPPSHIECLRYAATACPFLTRPHAHRREAGMPDVPTSMAGVGLKRNPGVICLWTTKTFKLFNDGTGGTLFELGPAEALEWYAEGRPATREEVDESVRTGLHHLTDVAEEEDAATKRSGLATFGRPSAVAELNGRIATFNRLLDRHFAGATP